MKRKVGVVLMILCIGLCACSKKEVKTNFFGKWYLYNDIPDIPLMTVKFDKDSYQIYLFDNEEDEYMEEYEMISQGEKGDTYYLLIKTSSSIPALSSGIVLFIFPDKYSSEILLISAAHNQDKIYTSEDSVDYSDFDLEEIFTGRQDKRPTEGYDISNLE